MRPDPGRIEIILPSTITSKAPSLLIMQLSFTGAGSSTSSMSSALSTVFDLWIVVNSSILIVGNPCHDLT